MSGDKALPQVLVSVKDPDTIIHGAHEFRRVCNARRTPVTSADGWDWWICGGCGAYLHDGWRYCPACGRRLQNPEEGDRA